MSAANDRMTWEEKFEAIQAIGDACLRMRKPGDWYVSQPGVEISRSCFLEGRHGNGTTPESAVEDHWNQLTTLAAGELVAMSHDGVRDYVQWNGYRWVDKTRDKAREAAHA